MRVGIADHFGWAVAVTASADHEVVDRRRIELVEPGVTAAPIHYESHRLDVAATAALVAKVRASVARATSAALDELAGRAPRADRLDLAPGLAAGLPRRHRRPTSHALRGPRRRHHVPPGAGRARPRPGWDVHLYHAKDVVEQAAGVLGERADEVLQGPRATLGPPWTKDHRVALAATIVAR